MTTLPKVSSQFQASPTGPGSAATDTYTLQFTTPPLVNGQTADGKTPDKGQVVATQDGHRLDGPKIVLFTFVDPTSAQFLYETTPNVQPNSTATMLMVATDYNAEAGGDIAQAWFTDTAADNPVTVSAILQVPGAPSDSQKFNFTAGADVYALTFRAQPLADQQLGNGKAENAGRAIVTKNGKPFTNADQPVIVTFTTSSATTSFDVNKDYVQGGSNSQTLNVWTHNDQQSGDTIADAYFTDSKPEQVTLTGTLEAYNVSNTQDFTFKAPTQYVLILTKTLDNQPGGGWTDQGQALVTANGGKLPEPVIVNFIFTNKTKAQFMMGYDDNIITGQSTPTSLVMKTHYEDGVGDIANVIFTDDYPEEVVVKAFLQADTTVSDSQTFHFSHPEPPRRILTT